MQNGNLFNNVVTSRIVQLDVFDVLVLNNNTNNKKIQSKWFERTNGAVNFLFTTIQFSKIPIIKQTHPWINDRTISKLYETKKNVCFIDLID